MQITPVVCLGSFKTDETVCAGMPLKKAAELQLVDIL